MLVLSRRNAEAVIIGNTITIRVLSVQGGQVRLGIVAPADIRIVREELLIDGINGDQSDHTTASYPQ